MLTLTNTRERRKRKKNERKREMKQMGREREGPEAMYLQSRMGKAFCLLSRPAAFLTPRSLPAFLPSVPSPALFSFQ